MLATKPKPKAKAKPASFAWDQAKVIEIPINRHEIGPLKNVTANVRLLRRPLGWHWRIHLVAPMFTNDDPVQCNQRRPAKCEQEAVLMACDMIRRQLAIQVDLRIQNKHTAIAGVCSQAIFDVNQFIDHTKKFGDYPQAKGRLTCPKGPEASGLRPESQASSLKPQVSTVIDVASAAPDGLSADERKDLKRCVKTIEKEALCWQATALAMIEVQEKKLWRETHPSFEAWLDGTKFAGRKIDRASAYLRMHAVRIDAKLKGIRGLPAIELDCPSQYRAIPADASPADLKAILMRVDRKIDKGAKPLTAAIISQAVHEENTDPETLKREAAARKAKAAREAGATRLSHIIAGAPPEPDQGTSAELPSGAPEPIAGMLARGPGNGVQGDPSEWREAFSLKPIQERVDQRLHTGSHWRWNGREVPWAGVLHGVRDAIATLALSRQSITEFQADLASLLRSLADEIEAGKVTLDASQGPKAELDGRTWREMPKGHALAKAARRAK